MILRLVKNPDIAATLGEAKHEGQVLVGFALETDHEEENAIGKLRRRILTGLCLTRSATPGLVS